MMYARMFIAMLVPVAVSVGFYLLRKKTAFGTIRETYQQLIIGLAFGGVAIFGTEFGVDVGGAVANARDAAPLCAGLLFGGPAGIIAGLIGGIERWFSVLWGAGMYSRVACSISTALAGFYAAFLRRYMFDNKRPTWGFGLAVGTVMEVLHMTILFLTHLRDSQQAYVVVKICTIPMVIFNSVAVMLAIVIISLFSHEIHRREAHKLVKISQKVQSWLLVCVVLGYVATTAFVFALQTSTAHKDCENLLNLNLQDVVADIQDASDDNLLAITKNIRSTYLEVDNIPIGVLAAQYGVTEINIVDSNGIITESTNPDFVGFDMHTGEQSQEFLPLLNGVSSVVQSYQNISYESDNSALARKYAGVPLFGQRFLQVGLDSVLFHRDIDSIVQGITVNRHVGENGYIIVSDAKGKIVSAPAGHEEKTLPEVSDDIYDKMKPDTLMQDSFYGIDCFWVYTETEGYYIIGVMPADEVLTDRDNAVYINSYMQIIVFAFLFAFIYFLIKWLVVDNIREVNNSLSKIISGNLNVVVDVHDSQEFSSLSDDINSTVTTLKHYIDEAAARIDKELAFAKSIQHSALPSVFPAYPNLKQFDIYATMDTAKEVGGDFYDFYMVDDRHLAILMADVSGKGIPAAMFMMRSKTMLKNFAETGMAIDNVFTNANDKLCEGNDADMFVTAWMGILDIQTGHVSFANAGHNPPLIYRRGEGFSYLKSRAGFVLAGMEGVCYKMQELQLQPGDKIFLYTDGITEATDLQNQLYGEDRLLEYLNAHAADSPEQTLKGVKTDVDAFVGEAEQFDDQTMLMVAFAGQGGEE